jgi:hypothetical protein
MREAAARLAAKKRREAAARLAAKKKREAAARRRLIAKRKREAAAKKRREAAARRKLNARRKREAKERREQSRATYKLTKRSCVVNHNLKKYRNKSIAQCEALCTNFGSRCKAFEYGSIAAKGSFRPR